MPKRPADNDGSADGVGETSHIKVRVKGAAAVDSHCDIAASHHVHTTPVGIPYSFIGNQVNVGNNNNKFYIIQLLQSDDGKKYSVWTRWGRVGYDGQNTYLARNVTMCWNENDNRNNDLYLDGMIASHGVATLRNATSRQPFFVAVGLHRPHLPWDVPQQFYDLYPEDVGLADHCGKPVDYNVTGAEQWSWDPQSGPRHCGPLKEMRENFPEYATVPDAVAKKFRRGYFAAVSQTDNNTGLVLNELKRLDLHQNTVVVFLGDHGYVPTPPLSDPATFPRPWSP